jgi:C4-dicarboxylate-specific signal transduction histidine kinase
LEHIPTGQEEKILNSLRTVMPTLRDRSERFLETLNSQIPTQDMKPVNLCEAFNKTADIHELKIKIIGEGEALINEQSLNSIFDNLFGNYRDQGRRDPASAPAIEINIAQRDAVVEISVQDTQGRPCLWPERLFEPFWSEKGDGLGIGLYHARQLVTGEGGSLQVLTPTDAAMTFVINLPKSV